MADSGGPPAKPKPPVNADFRPMLSVKDALAYLDSVKAQFNYGRPETYNNFLDVCWGCVARADVSREGPDHAGL
jgi:hypothetical protein